jgi:hypothetical protein
MHAQAIEQAHAAEQPDQPPPMTAETARRLAAALAPHWLAMRAVMAGTPYGTPAGTGPASTSTAATSTAATSTAAAAQLPPASAATTIFIAGMLERISA